MDSSKAKRRGSGDHEGDRPPATAPGKNRKRIFAEIAGAGAIFFLQALL
jgi:hypothetical protein